LILPFFEIGYKSVSFTKSTIQLFNYSTKKPFNQ